MAGKIILRNTKMLKKLKVIYLLFSNVKKMIYCGWWGALYWLTANDLSAAVWITYYIVICVFYLELFMYLFIYPSLWLHVHFPLVSYKHQLMPLMPHKPNLES